MSNPKIVHIVVDEKFIMSAYKQFEQVRPSLNLFYVLVDDLSTKLRHITPNKYFIKVTKQQLIKEVKEITKENLVVFHSLNPRFYDALLSLHKEIKVILFCFGYEVYNDRNYFSSKALFAEKTIRLAQVDKLSFKKRIKAYLRPYYRVIKSDLPFLEFEIKRKAFKRIDFWGSSFEEEFFNVQKMIGLKKKFFSFWYYSLEEIVDVEDSYFKDRNDVLVGNSSHISGNHIDSFEFLKKIKNFDFDNVIVPLGYGDEKYGKKIKDKGRALFENKLNILQDFMEYEKYVEMLKKCGVAIIYARRQQAIGNVLVLLWYGSKVFLSKQNTFYHYLKRLGAKVFCIEDYDFSTEFKYLSADEVNHNRRVLLENFNKEKFFNELNKQLEIVLKV